MQTRALPRTWPRHLTTRSPRCSPSAAHRLLHAHGGPEPGDQPGRRPQPAPPPPRAGLPRHRGCRRTDRPLPPSRWPNHRERGPQARPPGWPGPTMLWSATHSHHAAWTSPVPSTPSSSSWTLAVAAGPVADGPGIGATATRRTGRATLTCTHRHPRSPPRPDDGCLHYGQGSPLGAGSPGR